MVIVLPMSIVPPLALCCAYTVLCTREQFESRNSAFPLHTSKLKCQNYNKMNNSLKYRQLMCFQYCYY